MTNKLNIDESLFPLDRMKNMTAKKKGNEEVYRVVYLHNGMELIGAVIDENPLTISLSYPALLRRSYTENQDGYAVDQDITFINALPHADIMIMEIAKPWVAMSIPSEDFLHAYGMYLAEEYQDLVSPYPKITEKKKRAKSMKSGTKIELVNGDNSEASSL